MSYTITIGNAKIEAGYEYREFYAHWDVPEKTDLKAPSYPNDDLSNCRNTRHPSYCAWSDFCTEVGLHDLFFNKETGLMREHPGIQLLTEEHLTAFELALHMRSKQNKLPPGSWCDPQLIGLNSNTTFTKDNCDYHKVRLEWLIYWTKKALEGPMPAIHNS